MRGYRLKPALLLIATLAFCASGVNRQLSSARWKSHLVLTARAPSTRIVAFTPGELVALAMAEASQRFPGAVSSPRLELVNGGATGSAMIDFDRLARSSRNGGSVSAWVFSRLFTGSRPVSVTVEVSSAHGRMTVHPTDVTVSGASVSGAALDFLVDNFLLTSYPQAVVNRPFVLAGNIDRIEVTPAAARVHLR